KPSYVLEEKEQAFSIVLPNEKTGLQTITVKGDARATFFEEKFLCASDGQGPISRATGSVTVASATDKALAFKADLRFDKGAILKGSFEAKRCEAPPTRGLSSCPGS